MRQLGFMVNGSQTVAHLEPRFLVLRKSTRGQSFDSLPRSASIAEASRGEALRRLTGAASVMSSMRRKVSSSPQVHSRREKGRGKNMSFRWYYPDQVQRFFSDQVMPKQSSNTRHALTKTYEVHILYPEDQFQYCFPPTYLPPYSQNGNPSTTSLFVVAVRFGPVAVLNTGKGRRSWRAAFLTIVVIDFNVH